MPTQNRYMIFVDGENLVCRYQDMHKSGFVPFKKHIIKYRPDVYLWKPGGGMIFPRNSEIIRAHYYTSFFGDDAKKNEIYDEIKSINLGAGTEGATNFYPIMFKKRRKTEKAKSVDIQLAVDILSHAFQDNFDTLCLFSGDGDYVPILLEAMRLGKRVHVFAFSKGLSLDLQQKSDQFFSLDNIYFEEKKAD